MSEVSKINKNLALAVSFKTAPKELQDLADQAKKAFVKLQNAETNLVEAVADEQAARATYADIERRFSWAVNDWEPEEFKKNSEPEAPVVKGGK